MVTLQLHALKFFRLCRCDVELPVISLPSRDIQQKQLLTG